MRGLIAFVKFYRCGIHQTKERLAFLLSSDARCPGHEDMVVCGLAVSSESRRSARGTPLFSVWRKSRFSRVESVSIIIALLT